MCKFGLLVALFALLSVAVLANADPSLFINVNGQPMISLATFSDQFGAVVGFDDTLQATTISLGDVTVSFIPYSSTALLNGNVVELDCPMVIIDDITYLPLHFLCEAFNLNCSWGSADQQVVIFSPCNRQSITLCQDIAWGCRRHVWQSYPGNYDKYSHFVYRQPGNAQPAGCGQPTGYGQHPACVPPPSGYGRSTDHGQPQWQRQPPEPGQQRGHGQSPRGNQGNRRYER